MSSVDHRAVLHRLMEETLDDEARAHDWTYHAVRPMAVPPAWRPGQKVVGDCSKGVQYLCRWAHLADPMKMAYGEWGNSETLCVGLQHLPHASDLLIGDFVTFGIRGDDHATMVLERGTDPLLWSFGHQGAPNAYRLSQDGRVHQFLRNPVPHYVPTPAKALREKTGYWAWLQWKLGEGDWAHYTPSNPSVRPHVPKTISPAWWVRYRQFLANRHKANPVGTNGLKLATS